MAKLRFTEEHHEELGNCLFFHFNSFEEPPETTVASTMDHGFDAEYWTHFIEFDFNPIFEQAEALQNVKLEPCAKCGTEAHAPKDYEPEYCCGGGMQSMCGCGGFPTNPVFCDECIKELFKG